MTGRGHAIIEQDSEPTLLLHQWVQDYRIDGAWAVQPMNNIFACNPRGIRHTNYVRVPAIQTIIPMQLDFDPTPSVRPAMEQAQAFMCNFSSEIDMKADEQEFSTQPESPAPAFLSSTQAETYADDFAEAEQTPEDLAEDQEYEEQYAAMEAQARRDPHGHGNQDSFSGYF